MSVFFDDPAGLRVWFKKNHKKALELKIGFRIAKNGAGGLTWEEAVDEALCFGWIDGVRKNIDKNTYYIRFTPRRAGSTWSARNIERIAELEKQGRMTKAGLVAFAARTQAKSRTYSYEQDQDPVLPAPMTAELKRHPAPWSAFQKMPPSHRRKWVWWVVSAKQEETRARRFEKLIHDLSRPK
jgi:uncharacterized protein YdeI (YjbR/CyaY-like superfamily)